MKRILPILLMLLLLTAVPSAFASGESHTVTAVYQMDGYPDGTFTVADGSKLSSELNSNTFKSVSKYVYGTDFIGWFLDADCTEAVPKDLKATQDLTVYGGWQSWDEERTELMDAWIAEMDSAKTLLNYMPMYTEESFLPYQTALFQKWNSVNRVSWEEIQRLQELQASLVPVHDREEVIWDIWGDQIPQENTDGYAFYLLQDAEQFKPCLTAFLLEDQSQVKGNIVICSGGGFNYRGNNGEGYPTAQHMNALGYNCYVLQYRLRPYAQIDAGLDLQRAIRYIRYHAEDKGIAMTDKIATIGYSAGGFVVCMQATECYGAILPTAFYPDYVCDDVDRVNSDVLVAAPIYGLNADGFQKTENTSLPALFLAVGTRDGMMESYTQGFLSVQKLTPAELHVYDGVPHGFGMADRFAGADQMDTQFDAFLQVYFGLSERNISNQ